MAILYNNKKILYVIVELYINVDPQFFEDTVRNLPDPGHKELVQSIKTKISQRCIKRAHKAQKNPELMEKDVFNMIHFNKHFHTLKTKETLIIKTAKLFKP